MPTKMATTNNLKALEEFARSLKKGRRLPDAATCLFNKADQKESCPRCGSSDICPIMPAPGRASFVQCRTCGKSSPRVLKVYGAGELVVGKVR